MFKVREALTALPDLNRQLRMAVFPAALPSRGAAGSVPRRTSTASAGRRYSSSDLNRELRLFPAGPQPRGPRSSVPRRTSTARRGWQDLSREPAGSVRTSTASFGWQRSPPDLNREPEDMPDRTSERLSEDMPERIAERVSEDIYIYLCQKECQLRDARKNARSYAR